jgi:hypothetical protein
MKNHLGKKKLYFGELAAAAAWENLLVAVALVSVDFFCQCWPRTADGAVPAVDILAPGMLGLDPDCYKENNEKIQKQKP